MRDVLYSLRQFAKAPGFTFLAVLCLGLGIGVNTSIFSVLNSLFLRPMPVIAPDRLVVLSRGGGPLLSCPDFRDFRDRAVTLEGMAASLPTESSLDFDGLAHFAGAEAVSVNYPQVIGVAPKEFEGIYLPMSMDLRVPLQRWAKQHPGFSTRFDDRAQPTVFIFGRLKSGVAVRQASAEINSIAAQLPRTNA